MIDNWYNAPMRLRTAGGEISDTYIGERMDAPPTAKPPSKRAIRKKVNVGARPVATEVAPKTTQPRAEAYGARRRQLCCI